MNSTDENTSTQTSGGKSQIIFYLALGFGVVFINLWIIVTFKCCIQRRRNGPTPRSSNTRRKEIVLTRDELDAFYPQTTYAVAVKAKLAKAKSAEAKTANSVENAKNPAEDTKSSTEDNTIASPQDTTASPQDAKSSAQDGQNSYELTEQRPSDEESQISAIAPSTSPDTDGNALVSCSICVEDFDDEDVVRTIKCGHIHHAACIDPWLLDHHSNCPLCKGDCLDPLSKIVIDPAMPALAHTRRGSH